MTRKQKFRDKEITETRVVNNLLRYYKLATPEDVEAGKRWYPVANAFCQELSDQYGIELHKVAGITAALSPQTTWELNQRYAREFISNRGRGFMANRERTLKAKKIYNCTNPDQVHDYLSTTPTGAKKTRAFYRNIILPNFCDTVCIDRHALAAGIQRPDKTYALSDGDASLTARQYDFLSNCYVKAAKKVGMIPSSFQALIWEKYRACRGLSKPTAVAVEGGFVPVDVEDF